MKAMSIVILNSSNETGKNGFILPGMQREPKHPANVLDIFFFTDGIKFALQAKEKIRRLSCAAFNVITPVQALLNSVNQRYENRRAPERQS